MHKGAAAKDKLYLQKMLVSNQNCDMRGNWSCWWGDFAPLLHNPMMAWAAMPHLVGPTVLP